MIQRLSRLQAAVTGRHGKGGRQTARDLVALRKSPSLAREYLSRLLHLADAGRPTDYLTPADMEALYKAKDKGDGWTRVYEDKTLFDDHLRIAEPTFPLPAYLGQTRAGTIVLPDDTQAASADPDAFACAVASMREAAPTGSVFAKPAIAKKGAGAHLVGPGASPEHVETLRQETLATDYVFQGAVRQHAEIDRLYPGSLNTVRIVTATMRDGSRPVLSAILRMGRKGRAVDNAHAGGVFVGVDRETGALRGPNGGAVWGRTLWGFGAERLDRHPDTGVPFEGFTVPFFREAVEVARRAQDRLPLLYVGWDVGITPDGPVLIEGNHKPFLQMMEAANGGFKADPICRAFLAEQGVV